MTPDRNTTEQQQIRTIIRGLVAIVLFWATLALLFGHAPVKGAEVRTTGELYELLQPLGTNAKVEAAGGRPLTVEVKNATVVFGVGGQPDDPTPPPPPPPPVARTGPKGHGLMQGGNRNNSLTDAQFNHPKIDFLALRDRWYRMEPQNDVFNFSYNDGQVRRARKANKGYIWGVMTGGSSTPDHVAGPRYNGVLAPWSPAIGAEYRKLVYAIANHAIDGVRVKDDPLLRGVWLTGPTVPSQEAHLNGMQAAPGFSPAGIVANYKACADAYAEYMPGVPVIFSVSGQAPVQPYQPQIIAYVQQKFGKSLAHFQHNSLGTQTNTGATHHQILLKLHRDGWKVGAEMVQPGHVAALPKFPERTYVVLYPRDELQLK